MMKFFIVLTFWFLAQITQAKPVELVLWHAMAGGLGDEVQVLADDFNHSQQDFYLKPVYKGNYLETLNSFAAAFRAHQAPAMVQIFEVGTALMLSPKGVIKPVDELMKENNLSLPQDEFIQSVRQFYSRDGVLMGMPFNLSVPVIYYNRDSLNKVGYSEGNMPKTWDEMEVLARRLKKAGYDCAYTSAYPGWILFESYLAIHGLASIENNPVKAVFNTPQLLAHFKRLKRWYDMHYLRYAGREDDATILFTSNTCPMLSQSSGSYNSLDALVPFQMGVMPMPLDTKASSVRYANVAGGAALWAVSGRTQQQYKGIAAFFMFLAKADVQKKWHEHTGYLPLGFKGRYADLVQSSQHPVLLLAQSDLQRPISPHLLQQNLSPQHQIRSIIDEVLEGLFAGLVNSDEAMNVAMSRSNRVVARFSRNTH